MLRKNGQAGMCDGSAQGLRATPPPTHTHSIWAGGGLPGGGGGLWGKRMSPAERGRHDLFHPLRKFHRVLVGRPGSDFTPLGLRFLIC